MTENLATDLNFTRLCRCCALEHNLMYDIFCGKCSNAQTYYEVIMECTSIQFLRDDGLPSLVCRECVSILESFVVFRKKCIESESIFKQMSKNISPGEQETFDFDRVKQDSPMLDIIKEELNDVVESDDPETNRSSGKLFDEIKIENRSDTNSQIDRLDSGIDQRSIINFVNVKEEFIDDERDESEISYIDTDRTEERPDKSFVNKSNLVHQKVHTGVKPYSCDQCEKSFDRKWNLDIHRKIHTSEKQYSCEICDKSFNFKSNLYRHRKVHVEKKSYPCSKCDKSFSVKSSLSEHWETHTDEKPFKCDRCDKTFHSISNRNQHRRIHTGEKPFSCDLCDKSFSFKSNLVEHRHTHTVGRPYACDRCDKSFKRESMLAEHQRIHVDEQSYACDKCEKSFGSKSYLKRHQRIHTSEKLYSCDTCEKLFIFKWNLKEHQRKHSDEKPFACDRCNKSFKFKSNLVQHGNTHAGET